MLFNVSCRTAIFGDDPNPASFGIGKPLSTSGVKELMFKGSPGLL